MTYDSDTPKMINPTKTTDWRAAYACAALKSGIALTVALMLVPHQRLFEDDICRNYYRIHDASSIDEFDGISEELCKLAPIQQSVSSIGGVMSIAALVPMLCSALLYLAIQQKFSKKQLLLLNMSGFFLMNLYYSTILYFYNVFDPRWIYLVGIFSFVGGGMPVTVSLLPSIIADSVPPNSLSTFQLYVTALALLFKVVGTSIALLIMKSSPWLPVVFGLLSHLVTILIVLTAFEGPIFTGEAIESAQHTYLPVQIELDTDEDVDICKAQAKGSIVDLVRYEPRMMIRCLLPIAVLLFYDGGQTLRYILPYWMSRRYRWEIREVGWVLLGEQVFTAIIVAVLPRLAKAFLQLTAQFGLSSNGDAVSTYRDLMLAKLCVLAAALGSFLLGLSWYRIPALLSMIVMAGGMGFRDAYYSYLAGRLSEKDKPYLTVIYMFLGMVSMAAEGIAGLIISNIYALALTEGNSWKTSAPIWSGTMAIAITWLLLQRHR